MYINYKLLYYCIHKLLYYGLQKLNSTIVYDRDFGYTYFGFKTLERAYLLKIDGKRWFYGLFC